MKYKDSFLAGIHAFGGEIAKAINTLLLTIVYILGVGVTALVAKLSKKSFLNLTSSDQETYWITLDKKRDSKEHYYRQF